MFRRHFERRWPGAECEEEEWQERHHEHGPRHHEHGPPHHERDPRWERRFGRGPGRMFEREGWFAPPGGRGPFGPPHRHGGPFGGGPFGDDPFGEDGGGRRRQRRGDIKYVLLELLAEQPRHGYELIKELESRYAGFYRPSPGSVYPTLQLLEDEGHLTSETVDGKRVYTVTESGRQLLRERQERGDDHGGFGPRGFRRGQMSPELAKLRDSTMAIMSSVMQVARHGTPEQVRAAQSALDTARREVYSILAEAGASPEDES